VSPECVSVTRSPQSRTTQARPRNGPAQPGTFGPNGARHHTPLTPAVEDRPLWPPSRDILSRGVPAVPGQVTGEPAIGCQWVLMAAGLSLGSHVGSRSSAGSITGRLWPGESVELRPDPSMRTPGAELARGRRGSLLSGGGLSVEGVAGSSRHPRSHPRHRPPPSVPAEHVISSR